MTVYNLDEPPVSGILAELNRVNAAIAALGEQLAHLDQELREFTIQMNEYGFVTNDAGEWVRV